MREAKTIEIVKEGIRIAALHRLFGPGFPLPMIDAAPAAIAEPDELWLVKIIVSSESVRIQFKVYYTVQVAKGLYLAKHPGSKELPIRIYHDFIREYCNVTAGALKVWLVDLVSVKKTDDLVVNLPDQKPAMVELPSLGKIDEENVLFNAWTIKVEQLDLLCCSEIQVFDWMQVSNLQPHSIAESFADDGDEVEFL